MIRSRRPRAIRVASNRLNIAFCMSLVCLLAGWLARSEFATNSWDFRIVGIRSDFGVAYYIIQHYHGCEGD